MRSNGLDMAVYEQGEGPPVIFLHGFPELAYSWRHQLPAVAAAGHRAIAVDLRGYGRTGGPPDVASYAMRNLLQDLNGLMDGLDLESATLVGHDWGALLMWHFAMTAPERVDSLVGLNIPHVPRPPVDPIELFRKRFGNDFYIVNFQDNDDADRAFEANPRQLFTALMRKNALPRAAYDSLPPEQKVISLLRLMENPSPAGEPLLSGSELDCFVAAFENSGFSRPIHWYRNWSGNWREFAGVDEVIEIPTLFIAAADELVVGPEHVAAMEALIPDLAVHTLQPCGHWSQQERPESVNRLLVDWLVKHR